MSSTNTRKHFSSSFCCSVTNHKHHHHNHGTDRLKRRWMQEQFRKNEDTIVPILESLCVVSSTTPMEDIYAWISELETNIPYMCWVFIKFYRIASALRPVQRQIRTRQRDEQCLIDLKDQLQKHYDEQKQQYPSIVPHPRCLPGTNRPERKARRHNHLQHFRQRYQNESNEKFGSLRWRNCDRGPFPMESSSTVYFVYERDPSCGQSVPGDDAADESNRRPNRCHL